MGKDKLKRFAETRMFPNFFQPTTEEVKNEFKLKSKWHKIFFENNNPIVLELGCGKGEYTVDLARKYPDKNFIGIDIKGARMWRGCKTSVEESMTNVAFLRTRIQFIEFCFGQQEISEVWITFPDPFPKDKDEGNRLTSKQFLDRYKNIMVPDGKIHLKTDDRPLFDFTIDLVAELNLNLIYKTPDLYHSGYDGDVVNTQTFYENKFLINGKKINYVQFQLKT